MRGELEKSGALYGQTQTGKEWCYRALHPAEPGAPKASIPDGGSDDIVVMDYVTTSTLTAPTGTTQGWNVIGQLLPHPIGMVAVTAQDQSIVGNFYDMNIDNHQLIPSLTSPSVWSHQNGINNLLSIAHAWRISHMSLTINQVGPELANQGTVVAAQVPLEMARINFSGQILTTNLAAKAQDKEKSKLGARPSGKEGDSNAVLRLAGTTPIYFPFAREVLQYDSGGTLPGVGTTQAVAQCQGKRGCYVNNSKEGLYMPLKLTRDALRWRGVHSMCGYSAGLYESANSYPIQVPWVSLENLSDISSYLFNDLMAPFFVPTSETGGGGFSVEMLDKTQGWFVFSGMSPQTSLVLTVRLGLEMRVLPSSILAPMANIPPPADPLAVETYFAVAERLKDGYPADYNDLGKIWDVVSSIARKWAPVFSAVPGLGTFLAPAVSSAVALGDEVRRRTKKK